MAGLATYAYQIATDDRITWVSPAWLAFASANDAPLLAEARVVGQSLWEYVVDAEVERYYRSLVRTVRSTRRRATLPFRCDSPTARRFMRLCISAVGPDVVLFEGVLLGEEARPYVALWDAKVPRTAERWAVCTWCKLVEADGAWVEAEDAVRRFPALATPPLPTLAHRVCPSCGTVGAGLLAGLRA
jgi:hypothetical protein